MKARKMILGLAVALIAVGSAIANDALTTVFVRVKFQGQSNFTCVQTTFQCESTGGNLCVVTIPDLGRTTKGYASGCTVQINSSSASPIGSYDPAATIIDAD